MNGNNKISESNKISDIIKTSLENIRTVVDANTIIGEPHQAERVRSGDTDPADQHRTGSIVQTGGGRQGVCGRGSDDDGRAACAHRHAGL